MALFFVRWWKSKFLSGYKPFSGSDDDEESIQSRKKKSSDRIKLKEMECDVSISGNADGKRRDPQEFSFTLYDFDGHGKITKDDIAGLVTTIYETLGSSVKVPHCGSKTIRVKLIVTPNPDPASANNKKIHVDPIPPSPTNEWPNDFISFSPKQRKKKQTRRESEINHHQNAQTKPTLNCGGCGHSKKRSSSFQKQQLLKILQANMEKNNLVFQSSRRYPAWQQEKDLKSPRPPPPPFRPCDEPLGGRHHQKHKDREAEQARAMAQVVRWLEQEVLAPKKHHHVHEHVHHHYHHYQEPPIVA